MVVDFSAKKIVCFYKILIFGDLFMAQFGFVDEFEFKTAHFPPPHLVNLIFLRF